ncbi:MAG: hypothetical protein HC902_03620 [Calothrix sp. SM1_5_4]|nr:hypothetical protein [Calothrix sp. SM1_5_4]
MATPKINDQNSANLMKTSRLSKNYVVNIFAAGAAFLAILMYYATKTLSEINFIVMNHPDTSLAAALQDHLYTAAILFFLCFLGFLISTVAYITLLGHRVGGPIVAICAYIRELKKGNYDAKRTLRKNDELVPIMIELQELAQILKKDQ